MIRAVFVTVAAIVVASMGALAFEGSAAPSSLLGAALRSVGARTWRPCPEGMVRVEFSAGPFCIDQFEASAGEGCPLRRITYAQETAINLAVPACAPKSAPGRDPWTYITQVQARDACARAGKRLPTPAEWFAAALGTPEVSCVVRGREKPTRTGTSPACASSFGAQDMVGNVWEWVDAVVRAGVYGGVPLPPSGYIAAADERGVPLATLPRKGKNAYGGDRVWSDAGIIAGVMRGGFYRSGSAAGIYAFHAASPPSFAGEAVGFRCVRALE